MVAWCFNFSVSVGGHVFDTYYVPTSDNSGCFFLILITFESMGHAKSKILVFILASSNIASFTIPMDNS